MTHLSRIIAEEIHRKGPVSLARFMELALYCPVYGYYEHQADSVGRAGDFQTSVSVGPVFGELLAARFAGWLDRLQPTGMDRFHFVEAGAHDGKLAGDILGWMSRSRPDLAGRLEYHILEPSKVRREWQATRLKAYSGQLNWSSNFNQLHERSEGVQGIIFSNELLDALPVDRFAWDRGEQAWFDWLVAEHNGQFVWSRGKGGDPTSVAVLNDMVPHELRKLLPDGYVIEYGGEAVNWWRQAIDCLAQGWIVTLDYGFRAGSAILPERVDGTLRGYRNHQVTPDILTDPGEQDITAHVHFDRLAAAGESCGLETEFFNSQERFLVQTLQELSSAGQDAIVRPGERLRQFKTLVHPDHFGYLFQVLVQSRIPPGTGAHPVNPPA